MECKKFYNSVLEAIGNTPIIKLQKICNGEIFVKAEFLNPGGSIKDRVALHIINEAEKKGEIFPGKNIIIEATSGNTGIGTALIGTQKGYKVVLVMPENMSDERKKIIKALGAELILTPAEKILDGCLEAVDKYCNEHPEAWRLGQFVNPNNPQAHYLTTAPEIWEQVDGKVDVFVAGVGSGGTLQGVGKFLKEKNPKIQIVAVEPRTSSAMLGREPGLHQIQGIGDGFIPDVLDMNIVDMVITVTDDDAIETTRKLALKEGMLCGTSSGANIWAALQLATQGRKVVTVAPDRAERYFSTALI